MALRPFKVRVPAPVLTDLKRRLANTRWPDEVAGSAWEYGANLDYVKELVSYWRDSFDWRAQEALLNSFPQFMAEIDGLDIHFIHVKGKGSRTLPLIISHGWPGSVFEMYKVIGPLTDPAGHGGDPADAFDLVVPSLPGYGFSGHPDRRAVNVAAIADIFARLMTDVLGYPRFGAQGGDWGAIITARMGQAYPERVVGIHLNMVPGVGGQVAEHEMTPEVEEWQRRGEEWQREETGYSKIQGTKPQTLSYGLNDSPAGLAAWIVEKFRSWSDCEGEVERSYTKDELLTNIMIYWVTQTINSSTRLYYESTHHPTRVSPKDRVEVPTGVAVFPKEIMRPPRHIAERTYNIQRWTVMPAGGHFAALERPAEFVEDVRAFFRPLRG